MNKQKFSLIILILGLGLISWLIFKRAPENNNNPTDSAAAVRLFAPSANEMVSSPLSLRGEARGSWYFEASFPIRIMDANGLALGIVPAQAQSNWMTADFVPFTATLEFKTPTTETGTLVLQKDNPSGLPEHDAEIRVPIRFNQTAEPMTLKVFFGNSVLDPEVMDCNKVFAVERIIPKTEAVARTALAELLDGPTPDEVKDGYFTSINSGVEIQKLTIVEGVATVDFSQRLDEQMGGSCRVTAIRSQITNTLKQFATVDDVVISINGETDLILQP